MAVLCGMPTIQYSVRRLSVHKLLTSHIRRCLVSCACDWVMSALSAVLLIYSFQSRSAFLPCRSARRHSGVLGLPSNGHWTLPKIWVGFLYRVYSPGEWFSIDTNGKMETRHPVENFRLKSLRSYGGLKSKDVEILLEFFFFLEYDPLC